MIMKNLFEKTHFKNMVSEIEANLNIDNIDKCIDQLFSKKQDWIEKSDHKSRNFILGLTNIKDEDILINSLLGQISSIKTSLELSLNKNLINRCFIESLKSNNGIQKDQFKKYLVFYLYDNSLGIFSKSAFDVLVNELDNLMSLHYDYLAFIINLNTIIKKQFSNITIDLFENEKLLSNSLFHELINQIDQNHRLKQLLSNHKKRDKELRKQVSSLTSEKLELKHSNDSKSRKLEWQEQEIKFLQFSENQFYEDYFFGDFLMIYEKIHFILMVYEVFKEPFSVFCYLLSHNGPNRTISRTLMSNSFFTERMIGYLFYSLTKLGIEKGNIKEKQETIDFFKTRIKIINAQNIEKSLDKRYLINIKKESRLTYNEIEIKDKIDEIFDKIL